MKTIFAGILLSVLFTSCKKLVDISQPRNTITTSETFKDSSNASSAISGIYGSMINNNINFMCGSMTLNTGESADELVPYGSSGDEFFSNTLTTNYGDVYNNFWQPAYQFIYQANSVIEGVQASIGISDKVKGQFLGEAKFLRSLYYFYLINLFGDVPFLTSTDYHTNALASRTPKSIIYQQIVNDLREAEAQLPSDYALSNGDRIRANKWAAIALLARVYLYMGDWVNAESQASAVINNTGLFNLNPDLNKVFLANSFGNSEAILQWQLNTQNGNYNATPEGSAIIPYSTPNNSPHFFISNLLFNAFENGDQRKIAWLDSTVYGSPTATYYYPYKYKIGTVQAVPNSVPSEYVTVFRLAELYLIRAEARTQQGKLMDAVNDLDSIRNRAGLPNLPTGLSQAQVLVAVMQERRIELFSEWGHRWLDLKRTGQIDGVMSTATPLKGQGSIWQSFQQLYPIPYSELKSDPNLIQNNRY